MSIDPAVLRAMQAAGATTEMILCAVEAAASVDAAKREAKRANNAERQRRFRERHNASNALQGVTARDERDPSLDGRPFPQTPNPTLNPSQDTPSEAKASDAPKGARKQKACLCPDDFQPVERHFEHADRRGFDRRFVFGVRDRMHRWSHANANRPVARKASWHLALFDFLDRAMDEVRPATNARASPEPSFSKSAAHQIMAELNGYADAPGTYDCQPEYGAISDHQGNGRPNGAFHEPVGGHSGEVSGKVYRLPRRAYG